MNQSFQSASWYRVADKAPRLRKHASFFRNHYRGQLWYVLQDRTSGKFLRFSPSAYFVLSLLDGRRTLDEVWAIANQQLADDSLTQDEVIRLLGQLYTADVLHGDGVPDIEEMVSRGETQTRRKRLMSIMNPLAVRIPLFDPEGFLKLTTPLVAPFISWFGALLYIGLLVYGATLAVTYWDTLTENVVDRVLSVESVALLLLTYPIIKAIHELGHAYTITKWGGEVHEIGLMFLVFMPVPYVDASDSLSFQNKWQRALVGAAGILVELGLAAIAMIVWVNAESGLVRAFAFSTMLIAGTSTLFFNGNPLLRFDGYYVLSDVLEIPNLGKRANQYLGYLAQRLFGVKEAKNPATAPGEPFWFVTYGTAAFLYRIFITITIVLLVSSRFFSLGILLAVWSVILIFVVPLSKHVWFLLANPKLRRRRGRALSVVGGTLAVAIGLLVFLRLPYATVSEGVVMIPGEGRVHANADGVIEEVRVSQGGAVSENAVLLSMTDPLLDARVHLLEATEAEVANRYNSLNLIDPAAARIAASELEHVQADLALARERRNNLDVRASKDGRVALIDSMDMIGRFVPQGTLLAYVSHFDHPLIRVVVPESDVDIVRRETRDIKVRFISKPKEVYPARIEREVPALDAELPSRALATEGGGRITVDPSDPSGRRALGNYMHLDLALDGSVEVETIGDRVLVRFSHEPRSLAERFYRRVRQVFLRQFDI
jgi:putative peptide zinc metalloprotease protein